MKKINPWYTGRFNFIISNNIEFPIKSCIILAAFLPNFAPKLLFVIEY